MLDESAKQSATTGLTNLNQDLYNFRTLRVYLYYRVILAALLYLMYEAQMTNSALGTIEPIVFRATSFCFVVLSLLSLLLLLDKNSFRSPIKISLLLISDLLMLVILIHASGGIGSGLGYLLVITAAIASMFLATRLALGFAALTTLLIIGETIYAAEKGNFVSRLFSAGALGFLVFITSISFKFLTERIQSSSQEAIEKSEYARQLVQLAHLIVARMRTGIAVFNDENRIELVNDSALQLLGLPRELDYFGKDISQMGNLSSVMKQWQKKPINGMTWVHALPSGREVRISFASMETDIRNKTIVYLEDYRAVIQQAQQLKLASLGRLTASIAHEVRNPLGAISHAAQLLKESEKIDQSDQRFTDIILQHSHRVNDIIENVTSLSKRKEAKTELINLLEWVPTFIEEYTTAKTCEIHYIGDELQPHVKMDASHLRQILTNLFDNGLRFSKEAMGNAGIDVISGISDTDETSFIEVVDHGPGVPEDKVQTIFEPFYTTGEHGSGLGLYISKELCEINQASLSYHRNAQNKSCFRINFPHHQRMI